MPYAPREHVVEQLEASLLFCSELLGGQEFYNDLLTQEYIDDRRAELKASAGLKPNSPKAPNLKMQCKFVS